MGALEPAFTELVGGGEQTLYVGGAARLLQELRYDDLAEINDLMLALEERAGLLELLRGALETNRLYVRVGGEDGDPATARPVAGGRQLRAAGPQPGHRLADRPQPDGLRDRRSGRCAGRRRCCRTSSRQVYE